MAKGKTTLTVVDPDTGEVKEANLDDKSLEDLAAEDVFGSALTGTEEQLSFDLGGAQFRLASSTLKLTAIPAITVDGQFQEGDRVRVVMDVEIEHIAFPPIKSRGFRVGTERRHVGTVLAVEQQD